MLAATNTSQNTQTVWVSGKDATLTIQAADLKVSGYSDKKSVGIRAADNAHLAVDTVTQVLITGGTNADQAADGIRVSNNFSLISAEGQEATSEITAATRDAVFKKAVTVEVTAPEQSARGASVLVGKANVETDEDQGSLLTFKDALTVTVSSGLNAFGVEVDNDFLNGTRSAVDVTSEAGVAAEMVVQGLLTLKVA